jgi:hypothetical protein
VIRSVFGTATVAASVIALFGNEPRWFAFAGVTGLVWWGWDLMLQHVFVPVGDWVMGAFTGGELDSEARETRLTLDDNIRLLERHLVNRTSQKVDINSAIRLEEIYRTVKKDPERARRVIEQVLERYPDAPELERFKRADEDGKGR